MRDLKVSEKRALDLLLCDGVFARFVNFETEGRVVIGHWVDGEFEELRVVNHGTIEGLMMKGLVEFDDYDTAVAVRDGA